MTEDVNPQAYQIALLEEIQKSMLNMNKSILTLHSELENIRKNQERNTIHLKYEIDLSVARTDKEIADFIDMGLDINSVMIPPVPSALSIKFRGLSDEAVDLEEKQTLSLNNYEITRLIVTNDAGTGVAEIHVFGKRR